MDPFEQILAELRETRSLLVKAHEDHEARIRVLETTTKRRYHLQSAAVSGVVAVLVAAITALSGCALPKPDGPHPNARDLEMVVLIEGLKTFGTAFFIGPETLVTAGHVCKDPALTFEVGGSEYLAVPSVVSQDPDVCVLDVWGYAAPHWFQLGVDPKKGDHVWYAGFPRGLPMADTGVVVAPTQVAVTVERGASGAPIVKDGRVVGLVSMVYPEFPHVAWVVPVSEIQEVMQ